MMSRVVMITGAAGGIGVAIASAVLSEGDTVVACDRESALTQSPLARLKESHGDSLLVLSLDVTNEQQFRHVADDIRRKVGRLDGLVNAAGIVVTSELIDVSWTDALRQFEVNVGGVLLGMQACLPLLTDSAPAAIVNIASIAGRIPSKMLGAYAASKAAVISLTRTAAAEFVSKQLRVNAVAPGIVDTAMWGQLDRDLSATLERPAGSIFAEQVRRIPMKRAAAAADIAPVVQFLLSSRAAYVTGQTINVDGGLVMS